MASEQEVVELQGDLVEDYIKGLLKLTMWIPSDLAGKVIGKRGIVIANLKLATKVDFVGAVQPVGNSLWQPVVIIGKIKHIIAAYNEISRMVSGEVDDVVMEWTINFKKPFFLTPNRRTNVLQKISADTNVRIYYPESDYQERQFVEPFTLEGSCYNVQRAYQMLEKEVLAFREAQAQASTERKAKYANESAASAPTTSDQRSHLSAPIRTLQREAGKAVSIVGTDAGNKVSSYSSKVQNKDGEGDKQNKDGEKPAASTNSATIPSRVPVADVSQPSSAGAVQGEAAVAVKEKNDKEKLERVEKAIDVPSSFVGLLLSRGPQPNAVAVINQVQRYTSTFISKIPSPKYTGKKSASIEPVDKVVSAVVVETKAEVAEPTPKVKRTTRRRRSTTSSSDEDTDGGDSEDNEEGDDDEGEEEVAVEPEEVDGDVDNISETGNLTNQGDNKETKPADTQAAAADEVYPVTFRILSFAEENVDAAISLLQRMIDGERIREVLDSARISTRSLTQFGDRICELYSASAQPGGRSSRPRTERPERRDKETKERPTSKKWDRDDAEKGASTWNARSTDGKRKRSDHSKAEKDNRGETADKSGPNAAEDDHGRLSRPHDSSSSRRDRKERGRGGKAREPGSSNNDNDKDPKDANERKDEHGGNERRERDSRRRERKPKEREQDDGAANTKGDGAKDRDRNPDRRQDSGDKEKRAPRPGRGGRDGGREGGGREGRGRGRRGGRGPAPDGEGGSGTAEKESAAGEP